MTTLAHQHPTALDEFVDYVQGSYRAIYPHHRKSQHNIDTATGVGWRHGGHDHTAIRKDPRYIAYCREQDRKDLEEAQAALNEGDLVSLEEIKGEVGLEVIH